MAQTSSTQKLGYVLPGLGHLLQGHYVTGVALIAYVAVLVWGAASGGPRLGGLLSPSAAEGGLALHPWVAVVAWLAAVWACWLAAHRLVKPRPSEGRSANADFRRQFRKNRIGLFGMYLVLWLILVALTAPLLTSHDPDAIDVGPQLKSPSWGFPMGTDEFGRDIFSRVLFGARISLSIGFIAVAMSATIGTAVGAVAGYAGGWLDGLLMWIVDLLLSLPRLVLIIAIVGFFRASGAQSLLLVVIILGATGWMAVGRIVRSQVLSLKEQDFVQAGRALGASSFRLVALHLVPNAIAPVIVFASLAIGSTILVEASLSFLGLGVPPPTATWGSVINDGREYLRSAPWITLFPGFAIVLSVMSFNLLGDGLRDALDPKLRGRG